ncbi:MAG: hypothetical protein HYZ92_03175 [Candidatus Omnitrophica bacterium]|nr:hypothetical protein [Candidatus Omnitrophota bacterium]
MWNAIGFAIAVIGSVAAACLIFRRQIIELFPRLKNIGAAYFNQKGAGLERDLRVEAEALLRELDSELIREQEGIVKATLQNRCGLGVEAVPVLVRYFAVVSIAYRFLDTYMRIYGSQLSLLEYMNENQRVVAGEPIESLRTFYNLAAVQYPDIYKNDRFDRWLGFLKDSLLAREDGGRIRITIYGREFLAHMAKMGWSKDRIG